jgi:hypothetical protein
MVIRSPSCNETVDKLSHESTVIVSGDVTRTRLLKPLKDAPQVELKPDKTLPCYLLRPGGHELAGKANSH